MAWMATGSSSGSSTTTSSRRPAESAPITRTRSPPCRTTRRGTAIAARISLSATPCRRALCAISTSTGYLVKRSLYVIALARQRGAYRGRARALNAEQVAQLRQRVAEGTPKAALARESGVSRETLYQYLRENSGAERAG